MDKMVVRSSIEQLREIQQDIGGKPILHFGSLAGWPHTVARVSRHLGVAAENVVHVYKDVLDLDRKLPYDKSVFQKADPFHGKVLSTLRFLRDIPRHYCLAHYHSTNLLHREYHFLLEGPYLKRHRVPMVLSLGGGDARIDGQASRMNPYYHKKPSFWHDLRIKLRWWSWSRSVAVCASDPEMAIIASDYFEDVQIFRQPVEMHRFAFNPPSPAKEVPLLLHVPTSPQFKGTKYIVRAVENLKNKGLKFDFRMVRQLTQEQFFELLSSCDVYIDELRCGTHGMTAVEAMAMGKPTISYIRENLLDRYPSDLPLVNANPDTIEQTLELLILDAQLRHQIGVASRAYVERYHDADVVLEGLAKIYVGLLRKTL
ncbi:MAG: glycosyltransferase [Curvibacter sp.]|jgi:glycosyltransferase involved in cell wall biosynthesis|nr:glycosyltransferase [Curvibacter sp.]